MSSTRTSVVLLGLLIALVSYYLWPALGMQHFFAYSDNAIHGLPLAHLHGRILQQGESALWTPLIYGGHPIFAETQGAFANPVNILLSAVFEPLTVSILLHWLGMTMSITGMFALCRVLDLSPTASAFAALAAVFSPFWLNINNNMTVMAAVGWVPWTLLAFELWLKRPGLPTALLFGALTAMLLLPGYPHLLHGAVIYMLASLLPTFIAYIKNQQFITQLRQLSSSGFLAIIVTIGLVAVQLLPLLELIEHSHRSQGVSLPWFVFPILFERGLLFWSNDPSSPSLLFPLISSTMVCLLAAAAVFLAPRHRILGIAIATFLLGHLGAGRSSDVFNFLYTHHLIPGLHSFRIMHPYFLPAMIGICVLAAAAIDGITRLLQPKTPLNKRAWLAAGCGAIVAVLVFVYAIKVHAAPISRLFLTTAALTLLAPLCLKFMCMKFSGRTPWLAPLLVLLLLTEIAYIKFEKPHYKSVDLIKIPDLMQLIPPSQRHDYKFVDLADTAGSFGINATAPLMTTWYQRMLTAVGPSTNLMWDVPSIGGAFALNLSRHALPETWMRREANGEILQTPGLRMIDLLGLRFITAPAALNTAGFKLLQHNTDHNLYFYSNEFAQSRFQSYETALAASDEQTAFEKLQQLNKRMLVIETDDKTLRDLTGAGSPTDTIPTSTTPASTAPASTTTVNTTDETLSPAAVMTFKATRTDADHYVFEVDAKQGGWLFIADNMYPGWFATLDGKPTPLFAAQVMGKTVWVPVGKHQVEVRFESRSFRIGLAITAVTLGLVLFLLIVAWQRRRMLR